MLAMDPAVGEGRVGLLEDSDVVLSGDRIEAVGPDLAADGAARVNDGRDRIVLPGFVDLHTHARQS